jgi:dTDP-4-dehydrorhamnose reductase
MRVLVTGGSGQVGNALQRAASSNVEIVAPSSQELDIRQSASVDAAFAAVRPDVVINAAAYTSVDAAEREPELARQVNAEGPARIATACRANRAYLVHLSTDYVFDGTKATPYVESDAPNPLGVYGRTKLHGESAALSIWPHTMVLRASWVFSDTGNNFVKTILRLAGTSDELKVVDDQWGTPCSARSIAAAVLSAVARHAEGAALEGTYHFAATPRTNWHEFACQILALATSVGLSKQATSVRAITTQEFGALAPRPANSVLNPARLCRALGIDPPDWRTELRWAIERLASS